MVWTSLLQILRQHRQDLYTNMAGGEKGEVSQRLSYHQASGLTLSHAVDEASNHEDWVEVPLLVQVPSTGASEGEGEAASSWPSVLKHTGDM